MPVFYLHLIRSFYMLLCDEYNYVFIKLTSCVHVYTITLCRWWAFRRLQEKPSRLFHSIQSFRFISIYLILAVVWGLKREKRQKKQSESKRETMLIISFWRTKTERRSVRAKDNKRRWCKSLLYTLTSIQSTFDINMKYFVLYRMWSQTNQIHTDRIMNFMFFMRMLCAWMRQWPKLIHRYGITQMRSIIPKKDEHKK